jgi:hypothetical protein
LTPIVDHGPPDFLVLNIKRAARRQKKIIAATTI